MRAEKLRAPTSHEVRIRPVSKRSVWSDRVWHFTNPTAGADGGMVDWGRALENGSTMLDPEWAPFLETCKCLLWFRITEPTRGRPMKVGSIDKFIYGLWFIVGWMSIADYRHMHELDARAIEDYLEYLALEKLSAEDGNVISGQQFTKYIMPLVHAWWETDALAAAGVESLPQEPFGGRSAASVAAEMSDFTYGTIPPVDDATFIATVNCLEAWIGYRGDDIVRLMDVVLELRARHGYNTWMKRSVDSEWILRSELADFQFSTDPATGSPWHASLATVESAPFTIRNLVATLNLAGIIAIQATTGMRISEVCGLDADPSHDGPYPSCIEMESSASGLFDIFFISGKLFKTSSEWTGARWVAGLRPKGSDHLPPPVRAIMVVQRLFRRWRAEGSAPSLFMTMGAGGLPSSVEHLNRQRSTPLAQNEWIVENVGIVPAIKVTSHQWRKAFVKFLFRSDRRLLPALALHLKHVSLAMTEIYAGGDLKLIDDIDSEASRYASELLLEWASGAKLARGPVAAMIMERCTELGHRLGNHTADDRKREIDRIVAENSITAWPLQRAERHYGTCVFRPGAALCRGAQIGPSLRPDASAANPGLCAGCTSLAVGDGHVPFWKERLAENERLLDENRETDVGVAMLARKRIDQSRQVLAWFGLAPAGGDRGQERRASVS